MSFTQIFSRISRFTREFHEFLFNCVLSFCWTSFGKAACDFCWDGTSRGLLGCIRFDRRQLSNDCSNFPNGMLSILTAAVFFITSDWEWLSRNTTQFTRVGQDIPKIHATATAPHAAESKGTLTILTMTRDLSCFWCVTASVPLFWNSVALFATFPVTKFKSITNNILYKLF